MTYSEIRKMQDEMDELEAEYSIEYGVPGSGRIASRISYLQDEIEEAKAGLPSQELREWGIRP